MWLGEKGGVDLAVIAKALGHRPGPRSTAVYRQVTDRAERGAGGRLEGMVPATLFIAAASEGE